MPSCQHNRIALWSLLLKSIGFRNSKPNFPKTGVLYCTCTACRRWDRPGTKNDVHWCCACLQYRCKKSITTSLIRCISILVNCRQSLPLPFLGIIAWFEKKSPLQATGFRYKCHSRKNGNPNKKNWFLTTSTKLNQRNTPMAMPRHSTFQEIFIEAHCWMPLGIISRPFYNSGHPQGFGHR